MIKLWQQAESIDLFEFRCNIDAEKFDCEISRIRINFPPKTIGIIGE